MTMNILFYFLTFFLGATLTSFSNLMVMRIIKSEKITGRSYCDNCRVSLKLIDVLPILGYLINRGKCFNCKETIPVKHPIIELIGGLLYLLVFIIT